MVEDYLTDRDQEEALRNWWRENWRWLLAGVALGLGVLGGWQYWQNYRAQRAQQAEKVYEDLQAALTRSDVDQANRLLTDLTGDHASSAYTQQSRLLLAKHYVDQNKLDDALAQLRKVIADSRDKELADVARVRAARVLIQQGKYDEALQLLDVKEAGAFAATAREIRGDALVAKGDKAAARAEYAAALAAKTEANADRASLELKLREVGGDISNPPTEGVTGGQR